MSKWIEFEYLEPKIGTKTNLWIVKSKADKTALGLIKWYGAWQTYAFFPVNNTIFEDDCLNDIARFISDRMLERQSVNS